VNRDERKSAQLAEKAFEYLCLAAVIVPLIILVILVGDTFFDGFKRLSWDFITSEPSYRPDKSGIYPALIGSLMLVAVVAIVAVPVGVGAAVYLEEYSDDGWLSNLIEVNIANLAGVPSVIYGLLGLELFVRVLNMGSSVLAGGLTLALLVLPIVIMSSREALRTVPDELREASFGLGSTKWQAIRHVVLPMAIPGILTGTILSISRAIGETAPLIVVGALVTASGVPTALTGQDGQFTALPIQIFNWVSRPQDEYKINAAAGIVVLLTVMLLLNAFAILLRNRLQQRVN
jgi:phosphate transport system permease protein